MGSCWLYLVVLDVSVAYKKKIPPADDHRVINGLYQRSARCKGPQSPQKEEAIVGPKLATIEMSELWMFISVGCSVFPRTSITISLVLLVQA